MNSKIYLKEIFIFFLVFFSFFKSFSQIIITEVHFDTPYNEEIRNDREPHHMGEYIELYNYSDKDILLKNWSLTDYIGKFQFPDDAIILSGNFLIVAFRDEASFDYSMPVGISSRDYFTQIFPTTVGQEDKIIYQDKIILRNAFETLRSHIGNIESTNCHNFKIQEFTFGYGYPDGDENYSEDAINNPSTYNFYTSTAIHFRNDGSRYVGPPTPLEADSDDLPPIQDFETIPTVLEALFSNYNYITWEEFSDEILSITCPLVINTIEQSLSGYYSTEGICFDYDNSGNTISILDCDPDDETPIVSNEYSASELDEINSKIIVYPNPTYSSVTISWDASINGVISQIQVSNSSGVTFIMNPISINDTNTVIDLTVQPTGIFIFKFYLNTGQFLSRNVIKI